MKKIKLSDKEELISKNPLDENFPDFKRNEGFVERFYEVPDPVYTKYGLDHQGIYSVPLQNRNRQTLTLNDQAIEINTQFFRRLASRRTDYRPDQFICDRPDLIPYQEHFQYVEFPLRELSTLDMCMILDQAGWLFENLFC